MHPASAGKHWRPHYPRKATAAPYAAAIQFLGREPDPPKSGSSSPSALARILDPLQSQLEFLQLLPQSGVTAAIAERCILPATPSDHAFRPRLPAAPSGHAFRRRLPACHPKWGTSSSGSEGRMLIARSGDERQHRAPKLNLLVTECCKEVWLVFQTFVILRRQFW